MSKVFIPHYQELAKKYSFTGKKLKQKLNILIILRLATFLIMVYGTFRLVQWDIFGGVSFFILFFAIFLFLINKHQKEKYKLLINKNLLEVNNQEIEALRGQFSRFEAGDEFKDPEHEFSNDLEFFGDKNLFQYLNRTATNAGKNQLANWLKNPLQKPELIEKRQEAIQELKDEIKWRQKFAAIGKIVNMNQYDDALLISWSKETQRLPRESFLRLFIYISPLLVLTGLGLYISGLLPIGYTIVLLLVNRFVLFRYGREIMSYHQAVTNQLNVLKNYSRLFRHIEKKKFQSEKLKNLKEKLVTQKTPSSQVIRKLYKITDALDNTNNIFVEAVLNTIFLYNIHLVFRLEQWHKHHASLIEQWIETTGRFDAYNSFSNYFFNNPDFSFPVIDENKILEVEKLGHPLIPEEKRVTNNFRIDQKGRVFIITGANMAGKSTFLRTIGINLVLAMAGAPVCAEKMHFRITTLFTSMNITDSLSMNESYFYAEVKRLRQLVDKSATTDHFFVLLDEILTGTNTRDKEIASKAFLQRLVELQITGIIATHDLSLTSLEEKYPEIISNKRFEVDLVNGKMEYDYTIKDGVAQNMNALELLRNMKLIP